MRVVKGKSDFVSNFHFILKMLDKGSVLVVSSSLWLENDKVDMLQNHYFSLLIKDQHHGLIWSGGALDALKKGRVSCIIYFEELIHMELVDILSKPNVPIVCVSKIGDSSAFLKLGSYSLIIPWVTSVTMERIMKLIFSKLVLCSLWNIKENYSLIVHERSRRWRTSWLSVVPARRLSRIKKALRTKKFKEYKRI